MSEKDNENKYESLSALWEVDFSKYVIPKLAPIIFIVLVFLNILYAISLVAQGGIYAIAALIYLPISIIFSRISVELAVAIVRVAKNTSILVELKKKELEEKK
ncbi:MAG TPA: hypothetical protein EYH39_01680 [Desulfurobacteriaceae bacterium]|nr:hypothetical protein [Desulfurobacteriaceae bacterium]